MELTEDLKKLFHGTLSLRLEQDGAIRPLRLTEAQLKRYQHLKSCCYPYASAGIKLMFITSAAEISLTYAYSKLWNGWTDGDPKLDIFEDGQLSETFPIELDRIGQQLTLTYRRRSSAPASEITVYLPCNAELKFYDLRLGSCSPVPEKPRKFLVLGDSISQGLRGNSAAFSYTAILERVFDAELLNQSVGGDFFDPAALDDLSAVYQPTDVIAALGTNDIYHTGDPEQIRTNMHAYFRKLKELYPSVPVYAVSPPYTADCGRPEKQEITRLHRFVTDEIRTCCGLYNIHFFNGYDFVPHSQTFFTDTAHPNDLGFSQYALSLIRSILSIAES